MATSRSFGQFAKRMQIRAQQVIDGTNKAVRRAALAADRTAVLATPVDTGRARGAWIAAINAIVERPNAPTDKAGINVIADAQKVIEGWEVGAGTIFISNSVPYIVPLDEGHSKQAPNGMSAAALAAAQQEVRNSKLLE